jgi:hypothetical protein
MRVLQQAARVGEVSAAFYQGADSSTRSQMRIPHFAFEQQRGDQHDLHSNRIDGRRAGRLSGIVLIG